MGATTEDWAACRIHLRLAETTTYTYDADSQRVEKNVNGVKTDFVYDLDGHAVAEISGSGTVNRQELFAGGKHLGTYTNNTTYFSHGDWLGTERVRSDMTGAPCETIQSLPYGDGQSTSGNCGDPSTRHFTDKERDLETNLDYFGARYYSSSMGQFVTPDWAAKVTAVPYAEFADPQSLNLYSYVRNIPTTGLDLDGHQQTAPPREAEAEAEAREREKEKEQNEKNRNDKEEQDPLERARDMMLERQATERAAAQSFVNELKDEAEGKPCRVSDSEVPIVTSGGRLGSESTRAQNAAIADSLESRGFTVTGGGGKTKEEYIPGPTGGRKGSNYVDVTAVRNGKTVRVQTIDTRADGVTPSTREAGNAARIRSTQQPGDHTVLIPKKTDE